MTTARSRLTLKVPRDFNLQSAVCSYGYFVLTPNRWDNDTQSFCRPLTIGSNNQPVRITIRPDRKSRDALVILCDRKLTPPERDEVKTQCRRMLRTEEDLSEWYALHPIAKRKRFGRLFRSPTLFEDIVKTITGCNVTWTNTVRMNQLLCERIGTDGAFPTPEQLAKVRPDRLKTLCKVGYRAERIVRLAREVCNGRLDLSGFENPELNSQEVYQSLLKIHGIGPYAAANICMLLGYYDRLAIDTETYRHFCQTFGVKRPKDPSRLHKQIERHYTRFHPYPFLAYWFELWCGYETANGKPAPQWRPEEAGDFTAAKLNKKT